jgi:hypothetical protein
MERLMTTKAQLLTLITLGATLGIASAQTNQTTQTMADAPPPALNPVEQFIQDVKNPFPWMSLGGDLRIRNEYFNNALSLNSNPKVDPLFYNLHSQDYFRYRGRVWTSITPFDGLSLNARLAAEPREFMEPSTMDTYYDKSGVQWRYGIIDNLNVKWKQPLDQPITVTVGRQDIFLGDGWLVGDGTPEDGSFTTFLDSARATVELKDIHTTIDAIGIVQYARPDAWLPTLGPSTEQGGNPNAYLLTDQNEKGAILWIANKSLPEANVDAYFIYKHDSALNDLPVSIFSDNADIFTVGGRVSGVVAEHFQYSAEGAYQFGRKEYVYNGIPPQAIPAAADGEFHNLSACGVNCKIGYDFKDELHDQFSLSYEFLSGDDPKTKSDEMFDVLWGRWPSWSEMYNIYSYVNETRVGQTANLHRIGPTWNLTPFKDLQFSASYYALFADQSTPTQSTEPGAFTGTGIFRGHYLQAILKYKFSKHLSGHLWGELLFPGDYYTDHTMMTFLRAELMFTL